MVFNHGLHNIVNIQVEISTIGHEGEPMEISRRMASGPTRGHITLKVSKGSPRINFWGDGLVDEVDEGSG